MPLTEARRYTFVFKDAARARVFVDRVVHYCTDVAVFVDGSSVRVLDGNELHDQREKLMKLAQASGASGAITG